jgi:hypothetical protein
MGLMLVLYPFLEGGIIRIVILNILISAICFFAVYAVSYNRINFVIALVFSVPWFVATWLNLLFPSPLLILGLISSISLAFLYIFTAKILLVFVLTSSQVTEDVLYGAVSIYLLIGAIFNMIYLLIEALLPGSFFIASTHNLDGMIDGADFIYYSFATLTTLGFGDIAQ